MYLWILIFFGSVLSFIFSMVFVFYCYFLEIKRKTKPKKNIFIYKFNLFERSYFIEKFKYINKNNLKDFHSFKRNKISTITNHFSDKNSKKFSEIFNNLDNGSKMEKLYFKDKSLYLIKKNANYNFVFYKINDSSNYFLIFSFNHIKNKKHLKKNIQKVTKKDIFIDKRKIKGFIAFNIKKNLEKSIDKFLNILNFIKNAKHISYIKHNEIFILIIFSNKYKTIEKIIWDIKNIANNDNFSKTLQYLYDGSSMAISENINSIKNINQIFQILSFLIINSVKTKTNFLSANINMDKNAFKIYNDSLKIFRHSIKNKFFNIDVKPILNIKKNKIVANYLEPNIKKINNLLFQELISDLGNKKELFNSFVKKMLAKNLSNPIMINVYDEWLNENIDDLKNKHVLLIIHFIKMKKNVEKIQFIQRIINKKIPFVFFIEKCNDHDLYIVQKYRPKFVLISDTIWLKNKFLSSNQFAKLMILNKLAIKNKIKIIYKNPSLILNQKIYNDIGMKYYFKN